MEHQSSAGMLAYPDALPEVDESKDPEGELEKAPCVNLQSHACHRDDGVKLERSGVIDARKAVT